MADIGFEVVTAVKLELKARLSLCLTKHYAMKACGGEDV
jgi:hypothetical protein